VRSPIPAPTTSPIESLWAARLLARSSRKTVSKYQFHLREIVAAAHRINGRDDDLLALFRDPPLLGRALISDVRDDGSHASGWTLAQRRTAARSVAEHCGPELRVELGRDPSEIVDRALQAVAERVGGGYRIPGQRPRGRGGPTPSAAEVTAILSAAGRTRGWEGLRDRAFIACLAASGSRVTALRTLDTAYAVPLRGGRLRLLVAQKGGRSRHEAELPPVVAALLRAYVSGYNDWARAGARAQIVLGGEGPLWRDYAGRVWGGRSMRRVVRTACAAAGGPDYPPHSYRRFWATRAAQALPRWEAAAAGGWEGPRRFDEHYVDVRAEQLHAKLAGPLRDDVPLGGVSREASRVRAAAPSS
jgi:integrase